MVRPHFRKFEHLRVRFRRFEPAVACLAMLTVSCGRTSLLDQLGNGIDESEDEEPRSEPDLKSDDADPDDQEVSNGDSKDKDTVPDKDDETGGCRDGHWRGRNSADEDCRPWDVCAPGTFVSRQPSSSENRSCELCVKGFATEENTEACIPWDDDCGEGTIPVGGTNFRDTTACIVPVIDVKAGGHSTCALHENGEVSCWGDGVLTPTAVGGLDGSRKDSSAVGLAVGEFHRCATTADGGLSCWGDNEFGQLGDGTTSASEEPSTVQISSPVKDVAVGRSHSCALLEDESVSCWGILENRSFSLDAPDFTNSDTPIPVAGLDGGSPATSAVALTADGDQSCVLLANSTVQCWGDGRDYPTSPISVSGLTENNESSLIEKIELGGSQGFGVLADGSLGRWWNSSDGLRFEPDGEVDGSDSASSASEIAAGPSHKCIVLTDGAVRCWGYNDRGKLGDGSTSDRLLPAQVVGLDGARASSSAQLLAAGIQHSCALLKDGNIACWGNNEAGQLTNPPKETLFVPQVIEGLRAKKAEAGFAHSCALLTNGAVHCWGYNHHGQLGDGSTVDHGSPRPVDYLDGSLATSSAVTLTVGGGSSCVILEEGGSLCWGFNEKGQLGDGTTANRAEPSPVFGLDGDTPDSTAIEIEVSESGGCARLANGSVRCWGENTFGQLGNGGTARSVIPVAVSGLSGDGPASSAVALSIGTHSCAILADGSVSCWGHNGAGQIGDGGVDDRLTPTPVSGLDGSDDSSSAIAIAVSSFHQSCAALADGNTKCWGYGVYASSSADGSPINSLVPVTVRSPESDNDSSAASMLSAGDRHLCALLDDGTVRCWGINDAGQLGDGSESSGLSEVVGLDSGSSPPVRISTSANHTLLTLANGKVLGWGDNSFGQIIGPQYSTSPKILTWK